jgi:hypothetical protein
MNVPKASGPIGRKHQNFTWRIAREDFSMVILMPQALKTSNLEAKAVASSQ